MKVGARSALFVSSKFKGKSQAGLYGDVIMEIDWLVGEILGALKKNGLDEKTLVIFTSDNGPWLNYGNHAGSAGPLREGKGTMWEGGYREPCVMRWPGKIPADTKCAELASTSLLPRLTPSTLVIAVSASGGSRETVGAVQALRLQDTGARFVALTNRDDTELESLCDLTVSMSAGEERGGGPISDHP